MSDSFAVSLPRLFLALGTLLAVAMASGGLAGAQEKVIHTFSYADGEEPEGGLLADPSGNFYGTAKGGGTHSKGEVFEMVHEPNGSWKLEIIYPFQSVMNGVLDGGIPESALIRDGQGNLYGATYGGGQHGHGTVFELMKKSNGKWSEKILYSFGATSLDGYGPMGEVVRDAKGNLYGTTYIGGKYNGGTVFRLTPKATGEWTEKILHNFKPGAEGYDPRGHLALDSKGRLYGATYFGGETATGLGTVFELIPGANDEWTAKVIYNSGLIAGDPGTFAGGVILDAKGNVYGTSLEGGQSQGQSCSCGTVFELLSEPNGTWKEKTLYAFHLATTDGYAPQSALTFDKAGNIFGTTQKGGTYGGGTVFELSPAAGGKWTEKLLASFGKNEADGSSPIAGVIRDSTGNVFGVTLFGGTSNEGTVFEIAHSKAAITPEEPDENEAPEH